MKKVFITKIPDKAGAFLKAGRIISKYNGNIERVNYNKTIDIHTLFIEVSAGEDEMRHITGELSDLGYLEDCMKKNESIMMSLKLKDVPGTVLPILELLKKGDVNITYMSSRGDGTGYQDFKMGIMFEDPRAVKTMLDEISKICEISILDYSTTEKLLDSTVFYISFANEIRSLLSLTQRETNEFIVNSNEIMQILDERDESPAKTFEYIRKFAYFVAERKGENFKAEISHKRITDEVRLHMIEPPCGSNIYILENEVSGELLFIDGGFKCFIREVYGLLYKMFHDFNEREKSLFLTHDDIDHVGLMPLFDRVYVSWNCYENFRLESEHKDNFREQNKYHAPYCRLSKIIAEYETPNLNKLCVVGRKETDAVLEKIGEFEFSGIRFDVLEGNGGHVKGRDGSDIIRGQACIYWRYFCKHTGLFRGSVRIQPDCAVSDDERKHGLTKGQDMQA